MDNLLAIAKAPLMILLSTSLSWLSIKYLPSGMLMMLLAGSVLLDLITGILKAWSKKICSKSEGFKRTIIKIMVYCATIVVVVILFNIIGLVDVNNKYDLTFLVNGQIAFMIFIELYSVCENILIAYPNSPLTRFMIKPFIKFLKGRLNDNPINKLTNGNSEKNSTNR